MTEIDVTPLEIRDYAISRGWQLVSDALRDGIFLLNSPVEDYKQISIPTDIQNSLYLDFAKQSINKIASTYKKSFFEIIEEIREVNEDVISLRYYHDIKPINSLAFQETLESIEATKQLLLTAASSVVNPVLFHKRLARVEAVELLRNTKFRHTKQGSFIIKIACPIVLGNIQTQNLFGDTANKPMSRRAFELINKGVVEVVDSIERDRVDEMAQNEIENEQPTLSYNFCESLIELFDDRRELPFDLIFNWSRAYLNKLPEPGLPKVVKFPYEFKPKLEEIKSKFAPLGAENVDTFFGSVESLSGDEGPDGRRSGEVVVGLLVDNKVLQTKLNLNAEYYEKAYRVHGTNGGILKIKGKFIPGKRNNSLIDIEDVEEISK